MQCAGVLLPICRNAESPRKGDPLNASGLVVASEIALNYGDENNMMRAPVPPELSQLSIVEKLLVSRLVPMMRVTTLKEGGRCLNGTTIAFHQPVAELAKALPRRLADTGFLFVVRGLVSEADKMQVSEHTKVWRVRRSLVYTALIWLLNNCPPYREVVIEQQNLERLPAVGSVFDHIPLSSASSANECIYCVAKHQGVECMQDSCTCFLSNIHEKHKTNNNSADDKQARDLGPAPQQNVCGDNVHQEEIFYFGGYDTSDSCLSAEELVRTRLRPNESKEKVSGIGTSRQDPVDLRVTQKK
jgi:hypothetical protein